MFKEKVTKGWIEAKIFATKYYSHGAAFVKKNHKITIPIGIILAGIFIMVVMVILRSKPAKIESPVLSPLVRTQIIKPENIKMVIKGFGTVKPKSEVQIVPQISGKVIWINPQFRAGGFIAAGQNLFQIEPKDFSLAVEQAQSSVAEAEVKLDVETSEAVVAKKEWRQINPDIEPNSALVLRKPQIKQAQAKLDSAKAALSKAQLDLERTNITLPIEVCITKKNIDLGQYVVSGQSAGAAYGIDAVEIEVPLEDNELAWFSLPDCPAQVKISFGGSDKVFSGAVKRTTGKVDETSRLIFAVVEVQNGMTSNSVADSLIPGMFVEVHINGKTLENAYAVKRDWVHNADEIWLVNDGTLRIKKIKIARSDDEYAYITDVSGKPINVITSSLEGVVDGMKVRIASE